MLRSSSDSPSRRGEAVCVDVRRPRGAAVNTAHQTIRNDYKKTQINWGGGGQKPNEKEDRGRATKESFEAIVALGSSAGK